jgi:hypothetical protein
VASLALKIRETGSILGGCNEVAVAKGVCRHAICVKTSSGCSLLDYVIYRRARDWVLRGWRNLSTVGHWPKNRPLADGSLTEPPVKLPDRAELFRLRMPDADSLAFVHLIPLGTGDEKLKSLGVERHVGTSYPSDL